VFFRVWRASRQTSYNFPRKLLYPPDRSCRAGCTGSGNGSRTSDSDPLRASAPLPAPPTPAHRLFSFFSAALRRTPCLYKQEEPGNVPTPISLGPWVRIPSSSKSFFLDFYRMSRTRRGKEHCTCPPFRTTFWFRDPLGSPQPYNENSVRYSSWGPVFSAISPVPPKIPCRAKNRCARFQPSHSPTCPHDIISRSKAGFFLLARS